MTENTTAAPLVMDECPVEDGTSTVNLWIREGDGAAAMRVSQDQESEDENGEEFVDTVEIDISLTCDELYHLAVATGTALARLGDRENLIGAISALVEELGRMK